MAIRERQRKRVRNVWTAAIAVSAVYSSSLSRPQHYFGIIPTASAYVNINSGLPGHKHRAWLKKLTCEICDSAPGDLTQEMLQSTPQIMEALAQNQYAEKIQAQNDHYGRDCALAVESLLKRVIDERKAGNTKAVPTTTAYNAILEGWARSGEGGAGAERAEMILLQMQDMFSVGGDINVQPDLQSFHDVIMAWDLSGEQYAPQRAQRVLEWMVSLYQANENDKAVPDVECFDTALYTWAKSNHDNAPQKAEQLLVWMETLHDSGIFPEVQPHTGSFNAILTAWFKSKQPGAAERANAILEHMEELSAGGNSQIQPNSASYSLVAGAWARSGSRESAVRAHGLLKRLEVAYRAGDKDIQLNHLIFNYAINACERNQDHSRARDILEMQTRFYTEDKMKTCCPDVYSYTSVIGSCANANGSLSDRKTAFNIAYATLEEARTCKRSPPNHVTYGNMMKACARLLKEGSIHREKMARNIFTSSCDDGCTGDMVLKWLRYAASPELYKELMEGIDEQKLPREWTSRVNEKKAFHKGKKKSQKRKYVPSKGNLRP
uniref:Pentacotripeptide-repeat region of PRORP domain-containing protein n=1 Tax=Attheya septentrionalis TaxID=420275 RepID=A0A7S2UG02_9STRA|mmetsp:Transcript_24338/g.44014  ORF Transcript_24338/g.44014 Transcript_24338/m.44014 type:complete len:550 (+) Transcript_24338:200-1849(+)|eukprot:CAMPEP_0198299800 /NCGR_PEP_ID=MMETSP1449-20131203/45884_1 /TAXON_ID=420275 /ORGANISM="Attheya septentrionalis, Strain CCMP2084" /LENGTH=549 /DNA_ID=CAMNT_0044001447 /DNA_START=191 /DNA_END=1840 /DNA_ORIENTATION=+